MDDREGREFQAFGEACKGSAILRERERGGGGGGEGGGEQRDRDRARESDTSLTSTVFDVIHQGNQLKTIPAVLSTEDETSAVEMNEAKPPR